MVEYLLLLNKIDLMYKDILATITTLSAMATFFLGYTIYRKFLFQHTKQKQFEVVCDLIQEVQNSFNICNFKLKAEWSTLFDLAVLEDLDNYDTLYFFGKDIHDFKDVEKEVLNWRFFNKFYNHPLLPMQIAEKVRVFNITNWKTKPYEQTKNENCVIIGNKGVIHPDSSCFYYTNTPLENCKKFRLAIVELKKEIEIWLEQYGIEDINITTSHHFVLLDQK